MGGKSSSSSSSSTSTQNVAIDRRIGVEGGAVVATEGSTVSIESLDPGVISAVLQDALGFVTETSARENALGTTALELVQSVSADSLDTAKSTFDEALDFASSEGEGARELIAGQVDEVLDFAGVESAGARALTEKALSTGADAFEQSIQFASSESAGARELSQRAIDLSAETFDKALAEIGKGREFAQGALDFAGDINQSALDFQSTVGEIGGLKQLVQAAIAIAAIGAGVLIFTRRA